MSSELRKTGLIWTLMALALTGQARAATPPVVVEAVRVGLGGERNLYKVGTWTPVRVQLKATSAAFTGFLEVISPDDHDTSTVFRRAINLASGATEWVTVYTRPGTLYADMSLRVLDDRMRRQGPDKVVSGAVQQKDVQSAGAEQSLVATLGNPSGVAAIPNLAGFGSGARRPGAVVEVISIPVPDGLPGRWYGYDAAEAVVVDTGDQKVMEALDVFRGEALKTWVREGGHLVVAVGSRWQQVRDSILGDMLPASLAGVTQVDDLGTLESFAGSTKPISKPGSPRVTVARLEGFEARGGKAIDSSTTPLVVRGSYGFGRVTLVGIDVDQQPFAGWEDRALFWAKLLDLRRPPDESTDPVLASGGALYQVTQSDLSTPLHSMLEQFPGVQLVPFGWVAFFIFLYILLIGPGDYLFLKKVVKRMELTWVTFPLIVLAVSLAAYLAAYAVKGTTLRVNKIDAVDIDQENQRLRGTTWLTAFSPKNRDYDVSITPEYFLPEGGDPVAAPGRPDVVVSWFGIPEAVFGGMTNAGSLSLSTASYEYAPMGLDQAPDQPETLRNVRIPIWSTRSFTGRWSAPLPAPVVEADLQLVGTDRLSGTVTNRLKKPLRDAVLAFGRQVYLLGTIEPQAFVQVELKTDRTLSGYLADMKAAGKPAAAPQGADMSKARSDLVRLIMFRQGAGERATDLMSNPLHYLDLSAQLALDRPMLVADYDEPAATLDLNGSSQPPSISQSTVLRVILPLKTESAETPSAAPAARP